MIELNKIYNEDCMETMSRMPDNFVDLVLTDPPFNVSYDYHNTIEDNLDDEEYAFWCLEWINKIYKVFFSLSQRGQVQTVAK